MLRKNQKVQAVIEGYSAEGLGVARLDGQVIFVHGAVRGEACDILLLKVLKNIAFGKVAAVTEPSPHRQTPDCPYYGRCGGCDFRHMDYAEELWAKERRVQDALTRLGGWDGAVEPIIGAPDILRYRNKSVFPVAADGTVGFYRARTHQVQPVERCLLQKEAADGAARGLRAYLAAHRVPGYDETTCRGLVRHLFVRTNAAAGSLVCVVVNGETLPREDALVEALRYEAPGCTGVVLGVNTRPGNAVLGQRYRTLWGESTLTDTLCGLRFRLSVPSFYQVNREQAEVLYEKAAELAGLTGTETVLDLYCGAGTITQVMARRCRRAVGAEIVPEAVDDARCNAAVNGLDNAEFFCGDASAAAARFAAEGLRPDVICVDPPRKGLAPEVVAAAASMAPERIVYVSCDSATLGRDVKRFAALGYTLRRAVPVDLFPRTANVECAALLTR